MPKPFRGHIGLIQRNAISSWLQLRPACEILLMGDEEGTAEIAADLGVRHISEVNRNDYGTPLVDSIFREAERAAAHPVLCYINADIVLMDDFLPAVRQASQEKDRFLLVGRRWDLDLDKPLQFSGNWEERLRSTVQKEGKLHAHTGIEYFVFPRYFWKEIPPFAVGRMIYDGWLLYQACAQGDPVIDMTEVVTIVHQNHDYSHVLGTKGVRDSVEAERNLELAGGYAQSFTLWDAKYRLTRKGIRRRLTPYIFYRYLVSLSASHRYFGWLLKVVRFTIQRLRTL